MLAKSLILTSAVLIPFSAFAHAGEHADMSAFSQLIHMISDPLHLALAAAGIAAGLISWKVFQSYKMASSQDQEK
ncbi:MAG: hypothetical protein MI743_01605 [Sneathiellales bacterium]|nr:hypothetical protein [Sneathiellales bacterium]